jgi:hypothetical protein
MPLSSIVVIVIRLFAVNWLLTAVPLFLTAAATPLPRDRTVAAVVSVYAPAALLLVFTAVLWILSRRIARFVSRGVDATVSVGSLSRSDLYSFAFVFLGLFFILSSAADVINWLHYFSTASAEAAGDAARSQNLYQLTRPCLTLALGAVALIGSPHWTKKLASRDAKSQVA